MGAYRDFAQFRGSSEPELLAWLRQILIHCLHHAYETHVKAGRRDLRREVSLDDVDRSLDRSAVRLGQVLAAPGESPSSPAHQQERAVEIADKLAQLRPDYREVIVLRNLEGSAVRRNCRTDGSQVGGRSDAVAAGDREIPPDLRGRRMSPAAAMSSASLAPAALARLSAEQQSRLTEVLDRYLSALEQGAPLAKEVCWPSIRTWPTH